jgi:hypothetical protein
MSGKPDYSVPARVEVTTAFLAAARAKQAAYEARRRIWTVALRPAEPRAKPASVSRSGKIHDRRQGSLDL